MDDVVDRVMTNENRMSSQTRRYSPLVEPDLQYQKPDKDLGYAPAGDKYFLGRADFAGGVQLVSLTDTETTWEKAFTVGNFFSFAMQFRTDSSSGGSRSAP